MPFQLPTFNLDVNIWRAGIGVLVPPSVTCKGNLAWGRRVNTSGASSVVLVMTLLVPAGTDVRTNINQVAGDDAVEVPAGSKRYYTAALVDDIGKGFTNEHRAAVLVQTLSFGRWPAPMP